MTRPRVAFATQSSETMELTRLPPLDAEPDEAITRVDDSTESTECRNLSNSSLVEKDQSPPPQKNAVESFGSWSKWKGRIRWPWNRRKSSSSWRTGLQVGLGISIIAFTANLILLTVGVITKPGYKDGIGVLHRGTSDKVSKLSTAYHVLINVLSTGLLTSSSYCMQLLCAPRREHIDAVHSRGLYIDIGILSFRNFRYISRYRLMLVLTLVATSIPLHLLYNSAIFELTAGQDYTINFVNSSDSALIRNLSTTMTKLENTKWQSLYRTKYIPNSGDLFLVLDALSFDISVEMNDSTWKYKAPGPSSVTKWEPLTMPTNPMNTSMTFKTTLLLDTSTGQFKLNQPDQRIFVPLQNYSNSTMPTIDFPRPIPVNVTDKTWDELLTINPDSFMDPPYHIDYAFSKPVANSSSVQISLAFMLVVIICNALKVLVIYQTLKEPLSSQILTFGDAVSSFLEHPDPTTVGFCTLEKEGIMKSLQSPHSISDFVKPWQYRRDFIDVRHWVSTIYLWLAAAVSFAIMIVTILKARVPVDSTARFTGPDYMYDWNWATSSSANLPIAQSSFSAGGVLFNAWLANAPQLALSMAYFALNRMCTSICFTIEWNDYATHRKGLRTSQPSGEQRPAYFLQLPYRWAVPLTAVSGVLHWLLSQSLFLVLLEIRDRNGEIIADESTSTVGYSNLSLLVFVVTYLATLIVVLALQLMRTWLQMPPADHCSLVISAACHPPPGDENAQLKMVQWGVVRKRFGAEVGHCSFTSEEVSPPESGKRDA